ncbi:MAG: GntR family transcriptional regulator [Clostridia bacterium]
MLPNTPRIEPVARDLMYRKVAEGICRFIGKNGMTPGERLPAERVLAEEFAAGRNTVREALRLLEKEGIIEVKPGKGAYVRAEVRGDNLQLELMKVNYCDLLEIKIWLEQLAIRRAVRVAGRAQLEALDAAADALLARSVFSVACDRIFHTRLLECGASNTLTQLVLTLIDALNDYSGMLSGAQDVWQQTIPYHKEIARALLNGRLEDALAAHEAIYAYDLRVLGDMDIHWHEGV